MHRKDEFAIKKNADDRENGDDLNVNGCASEHFFDGKEYFIGDRVITL